MSDLLTDTISAIEAPSPEALRLAQQRQAILTKPAGSLGLLERIGVQLAAIAGSCPPPVPERGVVGVFAGDHGVCAQGVTPWPQEVTVSMLLNMAAGGAAVNVLSRQAGASLVLTDVGVASDYPATDGVRDRNVARGTRDMSVGPAMSRDEALRALTVGIETADEAVAAGADILLMFYDYKAAFNGVKDAVADGTISQARLDESVLRILDLKMRYGLLK